MTEEKRHLDVSVWLVPRKDQQDQLQAEINRLSQKYGAYPFVPHLTGFYLATSWDDQEATRLVQREIVGVGPITVEAENVSYSEMFTQTLFVRYRPSQEMVSLYEKFKARFSPSAYKLNPHLSLIYSTKMTEEQKKMEAAVVKYPPQLVLDRVWVVVKEGLTIKKEDDVKQWKLGWQGELK